MRNWTGVASTSCSQPGSVTPTMGARNGTLSTSATARRRLSDCIRRASAAAISRSRSLSPVSSSASYPARRTAAIRSAGRSASASAFHRAAVGGEIDLHAHDARRRRERPLDSQRAGRAGHPGDCERVPHHSGKPAVEAGGLYRTNQVLRASRPSHGGAAAGQVHPRLDHTRDRGQGAGHRAGAAAAGHARDREHHRSGGLPSSLEQPSGHSFQLTGTYIDPPLAGRSSAIACHGPDTFVPYIFVRRMR